MDCKIIKEFIEIRGKTDRKYRMCLIETPYGVCKVFRDNYIKGHLPTTSSALNPTDYIINRFKEIHKGLYDYSKVVYIRDKQKVCIVCKEHR